MRLFGLLLVVASLTLFVGCSEDQNIVNQDRGTLSGTVRLDPDIQGTIDGTVVQLFTSYEAGLRNAPERVVVVDQSGSFEFRDLYPGTYYIGLWKDNDRDGLLDSGDFAVDRGSPEHCACCVNGGCNTSVCPCIVVVP